MSILPHAVFGALVGSLFDNPILSGVAGAVSHVVLDMVPHFDPSISKSKKLNPIKKKIITAIIAVDVGTALIVLWFLRGHLNLFAGGLMGPMMDVDNFLQYKSRYFPLVAKLGITIHTEGNPWHQKLHFKSPIVNFILGVILQTAVVTIGLYLLWLKYPDLEGLFRFFMPLHLPFLG